MFGRVSSGLIGVPFSGDIFLHGVHQLETSLSGIARQLAKVYGARLTVVTGGG
jgi:hypothetical protein